MKHFYQNLDLSDFLGNKKFWKNIKPLFSKKDVYRYKITLVSNNEIITDDSAVAEHLNTFFREAVNSLDIGIDTNFEVVVRSSK